MKELTAKEVYHKNEKLSQKVDKLNAALQDLEHKNLPPALHTQIKEEIEALNAFAGTPEEHLAQMKSASSRIAKLLQEELGLYKKGHYQRQGATFGLMLGVLAWLLNFVSFGVGPLWGLMLGILVGSAKDNQLKKEDKMIDL